jgi:hypothetical protein
VRRYIYGADSENKKFLPVLLDGASALDIPELLKGSHHFSPADQAGYVKLYRTLTGQRHPLQPLGPPLVLPSETAELPPLPDRAMEEQAAAYLQRLREEVGHVKIGSIDRNTTQAVSFPIGQVYIPLRVRESGGPEAGGLEGPAWETRGLEGGAWETAAWETGPPGEKTPRRIEFALRHRKLIVQGDAGSGKSTFLKCAAFDLSHTESGSTPLELPERGFPLYVRVSELDAHLTRTWNRDARHTAASSNDAPTRETDPRWIPHFLAMLDWGATQPFFEWKLRHENTVLLLDGLDEAPGENSRERTAKLLDEIARQFPKCRIVVTTRPQALTGEARPDGFEDVWIDEFDEESVELFVQRWCACRYAGEPDTAERERSRLSEALQAGEIPQLVKNPLMLAALTVIHFNGGRLPDNRLELYEAILRWLAKSREQLPGQPDWETRLERLRLVALGMQTREGGRVRQIALDEAGALLSPVMGAKEALRCLRVEEADSGILAARGESVEFRHLTFQEYLAAQGLEDKSEAEIYDILWAQHRLYSMEWREVMRFLAAMMRKPGPSRPNRLFDAVIGQTRPSVADRARAVALLTLLRDELRRRASDGTVTEFRIANPRYYEFVREMARLFDEEEAGVGLDARTRAEAAEAWERLGDTSRLRLPCDVAYWVDLGRFRMGRYPVTVGEYAKFVEGGGPAPLDWERQRAWPYRPVVRITWHDATRYCEWAEGAYQCGGLRLPASEEWEFAAAGEQGREYPWRNGEPDDARANFDMRVGRVTPVGLFPGGNTPRGIADLAGNVWEWCEDRYEPGSEARVLRGGAFYYDARTLRAAYRYRDHPDFSFVDIGFRCVRE